VPENKFIIPGVGEYDWTMILAIACGVVHISLAQLTKAIVETRNKGFLASISTWGWTLLIVGGVIVGTFALIGVFDKTITKIIIIVIGIISALFVFFLRDFKKNPLINVGNGLWETYNTATGLLSDVLSYLRLYALGLAGGLLGAAFNDLAIMVRGDGGIGWIFFVLLLIVGHVLNIAMCALGAFVHPLRLNFLEFFKNAGYEGAGRKYTPLAKENTNN
jgi:V/A-type H+-transporting ATPase subunit I